MPNANQRYSRPESFAPSIASGAESFTTKFGPKKLIPKAAVLASVACSFAGALATLRNHGPPLVRSAMKATRIDPARPVGMIRDVAVPDVLPRAAAYGGLHPAYGTVNSALAVNLIPSAGTAAGAVARKAISSPAATGTDPTGP